MCIKFAFRRNLIYPFQHIFWSFAREILSIVIKKAFKFKHPYIYMPIMFFGEFFVGIIIYIFMKKKL